MHLNSYCQGKYTGSSILYTDIIGDICSMDVHCRYSEEECLPNSIFHGYEIAFYVLFAFYLFASIFFCFVNCCQSQFANRENRQYWYDQECGTSNIV